MYSNEELELKVQEFLKIVANDKKIIKVIYI